MKRTSSATVVYVRRPDATPESEAAALAAVYRFVLDCHARKKGGATGTADDAKEKIKDEFRARRIIPDYL